MANGFFSISLDSQCGPRIRYEMYKIMKMRHIFTVPKEKKLFLFLKLFSFKRKFQKKYFFFQNVFSKKIKNYKKIIFIFKTFFF
jgi:hypothetical protein